MLRLLRPRGSVSNGLASPFLQLASPSTLRLMSSSEVRRRQAYPAWASSQAIEAADSLAQRISSPSDAASSSSPAVYLEQLIDANQVQLQRLSLCDAVPLSLPEQDTSKSSDEEAARLLSSPSGPPSGSALIPGEHLCFFTPRIRSAALGLDGSDTSPNPLGGIFVRRMWAGGSMEWRAPLRVGQQASEKTYVEKVDVKRTAAGEEMVLVWIRKDIATAEHGLMLTDRRSWLFRKAASEEEARLIKPPVPAEHPPRTDAAQLGLKEGAVAVVQSRASLFRYSALTYNAHAIHLDGAWCRTREGQGDLVVHGPLTLALLLRKWAAGRGGTLGQHGQFEASVMPARVEYRAKRPLLVGERCWIGEAAVEAPTQGDTLMRAVKDDGTVVMEATVTAP